MSLRENRIREGDLGLCACSAGAAGFLLRLLEARESLTKQTLQLVVRERRVPQLVGKRGERQAEVLRQTPSAELSVFRASADIDIRAHRFELNRQLEGRLARGSTL